MANNTAKEKTNVQTKPEQTKPEQTKPVQTPAKKGPTYTVEEFAAAPESLGANADIVTAALLSAGKESYTVSEAKDIVKKFKDKEVK